MFDYEQSLASLEQSIRLLMEQNSRLQEEVKRLSDQTAIMEKELGEKNTSINNLKNNIKILKLRNALDDNGNTTEVKLRINQMIRNVDHCLSILRKTEEGSMQNPLD